MAVNNDPIDLAFSLLKRRANQKGATGNISPDTFNRFFPQAEFRFFNREFRVYAETQIISDSLSKWMSDPAFISIDSTGRYNFPTTLNLMHVDSMDAFIPSTTTGQINSFTLNGGTGYTDGTYNANLTSGSGTNATATITVLSGVVASVVITNPGNSYVSGDVLSASGLGGGSNFFITLTSVAGTTPQQVKRVEKMYLSGNLSSTYDYPNSAYPIYTQYSNWFQFYPITTGLAKMVYLKQPTFSYWNYNLQGYISTLTR